MIDLTDFLDPDEKIIWVEKYKPSFWIPNKKQKRIFLIIYLCLTIPTIILLILGLSLQNFLKTNGIITVFTLSVSFSLFLPILYLSFSMEGRFFWKHAQKYYSMDDAKNFEFIRALTTKHLIFNGKLINPIKSEKSAYLTQINDMLFYDLCKVKKIKILSESTEFSAELHFENADEKNSTCNLHHTNKKNLEELVSKVKEISDHVTIE